MIQITDAAAQRIRTLMAKQGVVDGGLRVGVKAGGCSGFSYVYDWAAAPRSDDQIFESADGNQDLRRSEEPCIAGRHCVRLRH